MPLLFKTIAVFLATITSSIVARGFASVGMGMLIYTGVQISLDNLKDMVVGKFGAIGNTIASIIGIFGIDVYISLLFSAYVALIVSRLVGGALVRMGFLSELVNNAKGH